MTEHRWWLSESNKAVYRRDFGDVPSGGIEVRVLPLDAVVVERGSWLWALEMYFRGKKVTHGDGRSPHNMSDIIKHTCDTEWFELPLTLPLTLVFKKGDRVLWYSGKDWGTGTYEEAVAKGHLVSVGGIPHRWYERVESLIEEEGGNDGK